MTDPFRDHSTQLDSPARDFYAITPSNSANEDVAFRGIYVGSGGNVAVVPLDGGSAVTFVGAQTGSVLPVRGVRVNSTGTTAASLVGLV